MSNLILPTARPLILCDAISANAAGKVSLHNTFDSIRATAFPHSGTQVKAFAQLVGGIGTVFAKIDVRHADRDVAVYTSGQLPLRFPDRLTVLQIAVSLSDCVFPYPGMCTVELFCHNQFVCDTTLRLFGPEGEADDT